MNQKIKLVVLAGVIVLVVAGAAVAYNVLADRRLGGAASPSPSQSVSQTPSGSEAPSVSDGEASPSPAEVIAAPDFTVEKPDGTTTKLSDLAGKPLIINFWASWCPPCKLEMPHFEKLYGEFGSEITFLMVDLTDGNRETKDNAISFIEDEKYTFPIYFDTEGTAGQIYAGSGIPVTFFVGADGNIVPVYDVTGELVNGLLGAQEEDILRNGIEKLITASK